MHWETLRMPRGKIKKIVQDKGFGFIQSEGSQDVFFHHSTVAGQAFDDLSEGQQVEYTVDDGQKGGGKGPRAASVTPI
jgi:CspA family cold shock protein